MNRIAYLLIPFVALAFSGCGPDEDGDNGDDLYERPEGAQAIVTDAQLDEMVDIGATIYPGSNPADLTGVYDRAGGSIVDADNEATLSLEACDSIWTVEATEDEEVYSTSSEQYNNCSGTVETTASYISGVDNCFSLYLENDGESNGCNFRWAQVISGCLEDDGISDYQEVDLGIENDGTSQCQSLVDQGIIPDVGERALLVYPFVERL